MQMSNIVVLGLLLAVNSAVAGTAAQELTIEKQPWYGAQPQSPSLAPERSGLDFALAPAAGTKGPTVALLGAARLPALYGAIYGARIAGAVRIVAIDLRTGDIYVNNAEPRDLPPLSNVMKPGAQPPPGAEPADSYFNVDLRAQLRLPPHSARYAVFLWLDEMVSPVRVAQLPGPVLDSNPAIETTDPERAGILFGRAAESPTAAKGIALRSSGQRIYVDVASDARQGKLNVLALDFRSRVTRWLSFALPRRQGTFSFDPSMLGGRTPDASGPEKAFFVVSIGKSLSEVLTVEPAAH